LKFFKLASIAFEDIENQNLAKNSSTEDRLKLIQHIEQLDVLPKLGAFVVSIQHLGEDENNKSDYFLLILEIGKFSIQVQRFSSNQLQQATEKYASLEKHFKDDSDKDVALVSASSIQGLKKAYPNYFADTRDFSRNLEKILKANKKVN
jgi:hypothetical protein